MNVNTVVCTDCLEYVSALPDASVDVVLTDPPYTLKQEVREEIHREFRRVAKEWVIVFTHLERLWVYPADQYLFWVKPTSTKNTSRTYSRFVELILIYGHGYWDSTRHWSQYVNVFTDLVGGITGHIHEKPESLVERLILNHVSPGGLVLDPFCGSGTIPVIAKRCKRKYIGVDNDPHWVAYTENRLQQ